MEMRDDVLAEIKNLYVNFYTYQGVVKAIDGIDLEIRKGETLGLVGETGCGKSVTASTIMKLILSPPGRIESGAVYFMEPPEVRAKRMEQEDLAQRWYEKLPEWEKKKVVAVYGLRFTGFKKKVKAPTKSEVEKIVPPARIPHGVMTQYLKKKLAKAPKGDVALQDALGQKYDLLTKNIEYMQLIRGRFISMIFQEPTAALNPVFTAGDQIAEVILQHRKSEMAKRALQPPTSGTGSIVYQIVKEGPVDLEVLCTRLSRDHKVGRATALAAIEDLSDRRFVKVKKQRKGSGIEKKVLTIDERPPKKAPREPLSELESLMVEAVRNESATPEAIFKRLSADHGIKKAEASKAMKSLVRRKVLRLRKKGMIVSIEDKRSRSYRVRMLDTIAKNPNAIGTFVERIPLVRRAPFVNQHNEDIYSEATREATRMLAIVRIPDPEGVVSRYPYELSGGMQQRVMIAIALACNPKLLIADEPTTALDVTIQAQILKLMRDLKESFGSSILLITHNLGVVAEMCDRVGVMYAGSMAEIGPVRTIFKEPLHPYTTGLMKSVPSVQEDAETLFTIRGSVPNLVKPPTGCRFHPRCDYAKDLCVKTKPTLVEVAPDHYVACHKVTGADGYG